MAGYTNSFTALDGDLITAALFQNEYTALDAAFDETTGIHTMVQLAAAHTFRYLLIATTSMKYYATLAQAQLIFRSRLQALKKLSFQL
jgi:hypothetical protein